MIKSDRYWETCAECDYCGQDTVTHNTYKATNYEDLVENGWSVYGKKVKCPDCNKKKSKKAV